MKIEFGASPFSLSVLQFFSSPVFSFLIYLEVKALINHLHRFSSVQIVKKEREFINCFYISRIKGVCTEGRIKWFNYLHTITNRYSYRRCSVKKVLLKILQNSQEPLTHVFSCEFYEIFKNKFFAEHHRATASGQGDDHQCEVISVYFL